MDSNLWSSAVNRIKMQDRLTIPGYLTSGSSAYEKTFPLNSDNAERILSRTAKNTNYKQRIYVARREKQESILNHTDKKEFDEVFQWLV